VVAAAGGSRRVVVVLLVLLLLVVVRRVRGVDRAIRHGCHGTRGDSGGGRIAAHCHVVAAVARVAVHGCRRRRRRVVVSRGGVVVRVGRGGRRCNRRCVGRMQLLLLGVVLVHRRRRRCSGVVMVCDAPANSTVVRVVGSASMRRRCMGRWRAAAVAGVVSVPRVGCRCMRWVVAAGIGRRRGRAVRHRCSARSSS